MSAPGRTITCPHCETQYLLPAHLLGSAGAQITCPSCERQFVVSAAESASEASPPKAVMAPPAAGADTPEGPAGIAHAVLDAFSEGREDLLREAGRDGRFFADFGPEVMRAYDEFRKAVGRDADPRAFREALAQRYGVDLEPPENSDEA